MVSKTYKSASVVFNGYRNSLVDTDKCFVKHFFFLKYGIVIESNRTF
jgi:hypothetical protein